MASPTWASRLEPVSNIFLRLIRAVVAPLLLSLIVTSLARSGELAAMRRLALRTVVLCEILTTFALLVGAGAVLLARPGAGLSLPPGEAAAGTTGTLADTLVQLFPQSLMDAWARNDILQIVVFALLFGVACNRAAAASHAVAELMDALSAVCFQFVRYVMAIAPLAVFAATAVAVGRHGLNVLSGLGQFVLLAYAAQIGFGLVAFGAALKIARAPIRKYIASTREAFLVAFATTSSAAALPQAIVGMRQFGVSERVANLVIPLSLSLNLCGSTVHLPMAALFVAQAAGLNLSGGALLLLLLTLKVTSKGVAGVPRANFLILGSLFQSFGLPQEGLVLLLAVDPVVDMIRTGVNIQGHCVAAAVMQRFDSRSQAERALI